jgi:predicted transcriptional regulator of viral defense system
MKAIAAIANEIGQTKKPVIIGYQLGLIVFSLYVTKKYHGEKIDFLTKQYAQRSDYTRLLNDLTTSGVIQHKRAAPHHDVFAILGKDLSSAEEIACCIDPFCYVSYMSAMAYHGLTDRLPKILYLTSPAPTIWTSLAKAKMEKDLGKMLHQYYESGLPTLTRIRVAKISGKIINVHASKSYDGGAYVTILDKASRVSSIGRTFLDMIRNPELCGSIHHVLSVYKESAARYLRLITDEIERHGTKIDKVRAGFILDEWLGLSTPTIEAWRSFAQRGGSRKLAAEVEYSSRFSEKWCLSINVELPD